MSDRLWKLLAILLVGVAAVLVLIALDDDGQDVSRLAVLAERIGCTELTVETQAVELYADEEGRCNVAGGERITILTYDSDAKRDDAQAIAERFGRTTVLGDRFAVRVTTDATAASIQQELGGEIR